MSGITLLGVSTENYQYGAIFFLANLGYGIGTPIAIYLFLPVFFKLQATSAYEVSQRFYQINTWKKFNFFYWFSI